VRMYMIRVGVDSPVVDGEMVVGVVDVGNVMMTYPCVPCLSNDDRNQKRKRHKEKMNDRMAVRQKGKKSVGA